MARKSLVLLIAVGFVLSTVSAARAATPTGGATTSGPVTITPAGNFSGIGSMNVDLDTLPTGVICTVVQLSGSVQEDGTGTFLVTFGIATDPCYATSWAGNILCTWTSVTVNFTTSSSSGAFSAAASNTMTINCGSWIICNVGFSASGLTGTWNGGSPGTMTNLSAKLEPVEGTTVCTSTLTGAATVTSPSVISVSA
jgi:hypothetical protein